VNSTDDASDFGGVQQVADLPGPDGMVSLREAIIAANNTTGPQAIGFNIPTSDAGFDGTVFTIRPLVGFDELSGGGTTIDGVTQTAFSGNTNLVGPEIVLNGGLVAGCANGFTIVSANNVVHGLVINGFAGNSQCLPAGVWMDGPQASDNLVSGCIIGLDATGTAIVGNAHGVNIQYGTNNRVGGASSAERNVISGNVVRGISLYSDTNVVLGNYIGTDVTGMLAIGNGEQDGIEVKGRNNLVEGNIISGNRDGVMLGPEGVGGGNIIRGNFLGTDVTGTVALGNREDGVRVGSDGNIIVGNLVSGNTEAGVGFYAANNNVVRSNRIGTDINGNPSLGNGEHGVQVCCGPSTGNRVEDNLIAGNVQEGVAIFEGLRNPISRNHILGNGLLGIRLGDGGPLPNDPGDVDAGPNESMNYPVLDLALAAPGQLIVRGTIDTQDPAHVLIEFFVNPVPTPGGDPSGHGEGAVFLGTARPNASGTVVATLPPTLAGTIITATATDAAGNTSEFAANQIARAGSPAFLHGSGGTANAPTLSLDALAPTALTTKYKDSPSIKFAAGNPWTAVGTWTAAPALVSGSVTGLGDVDVWLGLKNSDDIGTRFDLRVEAYKNGTLVVSGESYCIQGITRNPNLAKEAAVAFAPFAATAFNGSTDVLSLRVSTRIGTTGNGTFCGGHSNAVGLRLYFDAVNRAAMFHATFPSP
jgi:parallel beta-helix repeat protein